MSASRESRDAPDVQLRVGSFVSLISRDGVRYDGTVCLLNVQESRIGLKNVKNFGIEGRKKDGPQIPSIDEEYVYFHGRDIKELRVKPLPPAQPHLMDQSHSNPAIIQRAGESSSTSIEEQMRVLQLNPFSKSPDS